LVLIINKLYGKSMILAPVIAVLVHQVRCVVRFRASSENRPK